MEKTFIEFFAGVGLIHEALVQLGWSAVLANDNDPKKVRTYRANYPAVPFNDGSIVDLDVKGLPRVEMATASFPCIDLSQAGRREGIHGHHSGMVWSFLDKIADLKADDNQPRFLLLENVPNLLTIGDGEAIDVLLRQIAELGYAVDLVQVDARHFTPQSRNRVFLIAALKESLTNERTTSPAHHVRRYRVAEVIERNRDLPWHLFNFPVLPRRELELADIVEHPPQDSNLWWDKKATDYFWSLVEDDDRQMLQRLLDTGKPYAFTAVRRLRRRRVREQVFNVRFDGLASCIRTPKGGSSTQYIIDIKGGCLRGRRLRGIEAARLQGIALPESASSYVVPAGENEALFAFGDAVCVPAVRWVVENSIEALLSADEADIQADSLPLLRRVA